MRNIPFGKPILGDAEKNAVLEVLDSGVLVHGPKIKEFEAAFAQFTGAPYAVGVSSCTAGLHLVYFHLGLGPGDEVVCSALTHTATAHAVELTGAKAVFVDSESHTGNLDLEQIEAKISPRTKALCVVHYLGMPVDMAPVVALARRHGLIVIEDCALAVGSYVDGVHAGLLGDVGVFSFYPVKHFTTGEGGMIVTRNRQWAEAFTLKRAFGVDRHVGERVLPGLYDVVDLGFNYRMSEIHAVLGLHQLTRLPGFLETRHANYQALSQSLADVPGIQMFASTHGRLTSSYYCHAVVLDDALAPHRPRIIERLKARGVGTSIYYPRPVPLMTHYRAKYGHDERDFPVAHRLANQSIALPVGPHLNVDDMQYIARTIRETLQEHADG